MKLKRASFLTKLVVLALLIAASVGLLSLRSQLEEAEKERDALRAKVAEQTRINAELEDAVKNSGDPDRQAAIARDKLGLVSPGEKVIIFTD